MFLDLTPTERRAKALPKLGRRTRKKRTIRKFRDALARKVPKAKPIPLGVGFLIFGALTWLGLSLGLTIATHVFFGICILIGMIAVTENNRWIRALIYHSNRTIDLLIFGATVIALVYVGVTIVAGVTFASLGYTLVYAPWMRQQLNKV